MNKQEIQSKIQGEIFSLPKKQLDAIIEELHSNVTSKTNDELQELFNRQTLAYISQVEIMGEEFAHNLFEAARSIFALLHHRQLLTNEAKITLAIGKYSTVIEELSAKMLYPTLYTMDKVVLSLSPEIVGMDKLTKQLPKVVKQEKEALGKEIAEAQKKIAEKEKAIDAVIEKAQNDAKFSNAKVHIELDKELSLLSWKPFKNGFDDFNAPSVDKLLNTYQEKIDNLFTDIQLQKEAIEKAQKKLEQLNAKDLTQRIAIVAIRSHNDNYTVANAKNSTAKGKGKRGKKATFELLQHFTLLNQQGKEAGKRIDGSTYYITYQKISGNKYSIIFTPKNSDAPEIAPITFEADTASQSAFIASSFVAMNEALGTDFSEKHANKLGA